MAVHTRLNAVKKVTDIVLTVFTQGGAEMRHAHALSILWLFEAHVELHKAGQKYTCETAVTCDLCVLVT